MRIPTRVVRSHHPRAWVLGTLLFCPLSVDVAAQETLLEIRGDFPFGFSIASIGDVDQDGVPDLLISDPYGDCPGPNGYGEVAVYSGASGVEILTVCGDGTGYDAYASWAVDGLGDVDGDGIPDVLLGVPGGNAYAGTVYVHSGRTGAVLHRRSGSGPPDVLGLSVRRLADLDGDGIDDWIAGAPGWDVLLTGEIKGPGFVVVGSGATGADLHLIPGLVDQSAFGWSVSGAGDVDGDGVEDFAVGAPLERPLRTTVGAARVFSGATGALIWQVKGDSAHTYVGWAVGAAGDVDGDGLGDVLVGVGGASETWVIGANGSILRTLPVFGHNVQSVGDCNGDGVPDHLVSSPYDWLDSARGVVRLFSGRTGNLLVPFGGGLYGLWWNSHSITGGRDYDGDGLADLALVDLDLESSKAAVRIHAGNDLFLFADPREVEASEQPQLWTQEGTPGQPTMVFLLAIGGKPTLLPIGGIGFFDAAGVRVLTEATLPPVLTGVDLEYQSFALDATGKGIASARETVTLR